MTLVYIPSNTSVLIGKETSWGTKATADKDVGLIQNCTPAERNNLEKVHSVAARNVNTVVAHKYEATISLEAIFQHGRMLEYAFGAVSHDITDTPDIKHTFTEADTLPSFTLHNGFSGTTDVNVDYMGCKVNTLTLAQDATGQMTMRSEIIAKTSSQASTAIASSISTLATLPAWTTTLTAGTDGTEGTVALVRNWEVTAGNGLIQTEAVGSRLLANLGEGPRDYDGRVTVAFNTSSEWQRFLGGASPSTGTPTATSFVMNASRGTVGTDARTLYVDFDKVTYDSVSSPVAVGGVIYQDFDFIAEELTECYTYDSIATSSW